MKTDVFFKGFKLHELRITRGFSLENVAEHLEITTNNLIQLECNLATPDIRILFLLSEYFKVPPEFFVEIKQLENSETDQHIRKNHPKLSLMKRTAHFIDPTFSSMPSSVLGLKSIIIRQLFRNGFKSDTVGEICNALESGSILRTRHLGEKSLLDTLIAVYKLTGMDFSDAYVNLGCNIKEKVSYTCFSEEDH